MSETQPLFEEFSAVAHEDWMAKVQSDLGVSSPESLLEWSSVEGVTMPAYLQREALEDASHVDPEAASPPLAQGSTRPANAWTLCHPIAHPDPDTANKHAQSALDGGAEALALNVTSEMGDVEQTVRSPDDLATVLTGIDLRETGLHLGGGLRGLVLYTLIRDHLSSENIDPASVHGSVAYDPIAVLTAGPSPSADCAFALADQLQRDADDLPDMRSVTVDARVYHDAGASAVQELAYTLGALAERLARSTEQDISLAAFLEDLQIILSVSTSYFVEIAKLRALRLLVPQVLAAFSDETASDLEFNPDDLLVRTDTSRRTETIYDPYVNMLRGTTEAMAAVLGGCDVLTIRPYDASLRPPDAFGSRIARNTQLVLRHEAHLDQVADPAAGSYYVETLTDKLAKKAWEAFQALEASGGLLDALRDGTVQEDLAEVRKARRDAVDQREHILVGTTHYPSLDEKRREDLTDPDTPPSSNGTSPSVLEAESIDAIGRALDDGATVDQICASLHEETTPVEPLPRIRLAADIEAIRLRTEQYADAHEGPPSVLLAPLGPPAARSARATYVRNFLGVAGFAIEEPLKFDAVEEAADAAVEQQIDIVVLCSSNAAYTELTPSFASALADRDQDVLLGIAGSPDDIDAGDTPDFFVHQGSSLKETLTALQERLGIPVTSDP
jgi:methylmalonyl-CoA mutase